MIEKWSIGFPAPTGEEPRHVYVYTPEGDQDMRYPVLYMFDGHNVFIDEDAPTARVGVWLNLQMFWPADNTGKEFVCKLKKR